VQSGQTLSLPPLDLPKALVQLLARMLHPAYQQRPSVAEIFDDLKSLNLPEETAPKPRVVKAKFVAKKEKPASTSSEPTTKNSDSSSKLRGKGLNIGKK
ncbi:MAG: hypothetical protein AAFU64_07870, partial [Bacteroidota bacterium]